MHKFSLNRLEFQILIPALLITFLGLTTFYSIDVNIFNQQMFFLLVSVVFFFIFLNIDYKIFTSYSKQIYILMIIALLALFFVGIEARGAVRWIELFGARIQFSEIIKPFYIIFLASLLNKDNSHSFSKFVKILLYMIPVFFLTLKQPDLGNAMIYLITTIFMLLIYGFPISYFISLGVILLAPMPLVFNFLHSYQKERIMTFFDPTRDPFGSSYNAVQSLISIGSGSVFGKGFGEATQSILKFLPERHTDFIFATISESLGLFGSVIIMGLYAFLLFRIYKIGQVVSEDMTRLTIMGFYFLLLTHIFLNIGMNLGIMPIVGITLPFLSYGGSSLVTNFIILGIVSSVRFDFKKIKSLEIT